MGEKCEKCRFQPAFVVHSTQRLVKIYNRWLFYYFKHFTKRPFSNFSEIRRKISHLRVGKTYQLLLRCIYRRAIWHWRRGKNINYSCDVASFSIKLSSVFDISSRSCFSTKRCCPLLRYSTSTSSEVTSSISFMLRSNGIVSSSTPWSILQKFLTFDQNLGQA